MGGVSREDALNAGGVSAAQIDRILGRYKSPFVGKGAVIHNVCRTEGVNPVVLLAVMQQNSSFGNVANDPKLHRENIANPFAIHFNAQAKGVAKLRQPSGALGTFDQSLRAAARQVKQAAASNQPLLALSRSLGGSATGLDSKWAESVGSHYETLSRQVSMM